MAGKELQSTNESPFKEIEDKINKKEALVAKLENSLL